MNPNVSRVLCFSVSLPEQEEQEEEVQRMLLSEALRESPICLSEASEGGVCQVLMGWKYGGSTGGRHYRVSCTLWTTFFAKWSILFSENSVGSSCGVAAEEISFAYVFLRVCSVCPAILGDAIKEKLHLQTLCDSAGWLRHFRGLTATAECSKFVVLWNSLGVPKLWSREESEHNTIQEDGMYIMSQMMWNEL